MEPVSQWQAIVVDAIRRTEERNRFLWAVLLSALGAFYLTLGEVLERSAPDIATVFAIIAGAGIAFSLAVNSVLAPIYKRLNPPGQLFSGLVVWVSMVKLVKNGGLPRSVTRLTIPGLAALALTVPLTAWVLATSPDFFHFAGAICLLLYSSSVLLFGAILSRLSPDAFKEMMKAAFPGFKAGLGAVADQQAVHVAAIEEELFDEHERPVQQVTIHPSERDKVARFAGFAALTVNGLLLGALALITSYLVAKPYDYSLAAGTAVLLALFVLQLFLLLVHDNSLQHLEELSRGIQRGSFGQDQVPGVLDVLDTLRSLGFFYDVPLRQLCSACGIVSRG